MSLRFGRYNETHPGFIPVKVDLKVLERRELFPNLLKVGVVEIALAVPVSAAELEAFQRLAVNVCDLLKWEWVIKATET
jgi:hypothetical protein